MDAQLPSGQPATLRRRCLQLVAASLVEHRWNGSGAGSAAQQLQGGAAALPLELQQELLLLLASWRLLGDDAICTLLGDDSAMANASVLSGAATVSLSHCVLLSGGTLQHLFGGQQLPQLQSLSLCGLPRLTNAHVALVAKHCPALTRLDLSKCPELTGAAVQAMAAAACAPQLQALSLAGCWQVAQLPGLAQRCSALISLDLSGCWQLTDSQLQRTLACLPLLEDLNLSGCHNLRSSGLVTAMRGPHIGAAMLAGPAPPPPGRLEGGAGAEQAAVQQPGEQQQQAEPAAAGRQQAGEEPLENWEGGRAYLIGADEEAAAVEATLGLFPTDGIALPRLRSLDVSGTQADDCLLYWLAQRCCGRLQKLALGNNSVTGRGLGALLLAKRALLHHARGSGASRAGVVVGSTAQPCTAAEGQARAAEIGVLPLLELSVAGTPACGAAERQGHVPRRWAEAAMANWEAAQGGYTIYGPPATTSLGSSAGCTGDSTCRPVVTVSLLEPPADSPAAGRLWPPHSLAEALECLGPAGLSQLQALDAGGTAVVGALAELLAAHCSSLQRLRLPGCTSLSDASLAAVLAVAPQLRELDVSGCTGVKVSRPGSRFLRHKAARLQEGGLTDASLRLLGQTQQAQQAQQPQQVQAQLAQQGQLQAQQQQPRLQSLKAGGLSLTDATLAALPPSLTALSLRGCKRISDSGVLQLLLHCASLSRLDAAGCSQLTTACFGSHLPLSFSARQGSRDLSVHSSGSSSTTGIRASSSSSSNQLGSKDREMEQQLQAFRRVLSTASAVRLQRAALPKQACSLETLAWLAGQTSSGCGSGGGAASVSGSSRTVGLPGWPALQRLELASCASLAEADLLALAACCPQLRSLQLSAAGPAAGSRLCAALAQRCRLLSCLSLSGGTGVGDADVALLLRELPGLQQLDLSGCIGNTGAAFVERLHLAAAGRKPKAAGCATATADATSVIGPAAAAAAGQGEDAVPPAAAAGCAAEGSAAEGPAGRTALRVLRLDGCPIGQAAAVALGGICPHLETLSLRQCTGVTSAAASALLWCCRNLRQLLLGGTRASDMFGAARDVPLHFQAAAAAAGVPCAQGQSPTDALLAAQPSSTQPSPLSFVELPRDSRAVRCTADWPAVGVLGRPRVQLA